MSSKSRYGLRLMMDLMLAGAERRKISLHAVAARQDISEKYLWQIANRLKCAGLINAVPGSGGGYMLSRNPKDITLADILEALEGKLSLAPCTAETAVCSRQDICMAHAAWDMLNSKITGILTSTTLRSLLESRPAGAAPPPYSI